MMFSFFFGASKTWLMVVYKGLEALLSVDVSTEKDPENPSGRSDIPSQPTFWGTTLGRETR